MLHQMSKRVRDQQNGEHIGELLSSHGCNKFGLENMQTYVFDQQKFAKVFPANDYQEDERTEIQQRYAACAALDPSDYVVRVCDYYPSAKNFYCIYDHFCRYGHVAHLRDGLDEDDRTPLYEKFYNMQRTELTADTVVNILRATVHTLLMVEQQATMQPNYAQIHMRLDLKGVFVCGSLPHAPLVRLSGFSEKDGKILEHDDPNLYWHISDPKSKNRLVWFLGKMALFLLTDMELKELPLTVEAQDDNAISERLNSQEYRLPENPLHIFLQRALIAKDLSWQEFLSGLDHYPKQKCWDLKLDSVHRKFLSQLIKQNASAAIRIISDTKATCNHPKIDNLKLEPQKGNLEIAKDASPIVPNADQAGIKKIQIASPQPKQQAPNMEPSLISNNILNQTPETKRIFIRNKMAAELWRLRDSSNIIFKARNSIDKLMADSQYGPEVMNLFCLNMMIFHKCRVTINIFKGYLERRELPNNPVIIPAAEFDDAMNYLGNFKNSVTEYSEKVFEYSEKFKSAFYQNLAVKRGSLTSLHEGHFFSEFLTYSSNMSDATKVQILLKNAWIRCYQHHTTPPPTQPPASPETRQLYDRLLSHTHHLLHGPYFTALSASTALPSTPLDETRDTHLLSDLRACQKAVEDAPGRYFELLRTRLDPQALKLEVWQSKHA